SSSHFSSTATPATASYTLSLHDALPILSTSKMRWPTSSDARVTRSCSILRKEARSEALASTGSTLTPQTDHSQRSRRRWASLARSEEHTSELQSRGHLVCRLLLEKKNRY